MNLHSYSPRLLFEVVKIWCDGSWTYCCWSFLSFMKIGMGKVMLFFCLCVSFPVVYRLLVFSRHSCWFIAFVRWPISLLCNCLSTSLAHFTLGCPHHCLAASDQVIIHLGHLLSSMHTMFPYHFNILFSIFSKVVYVTPILSLIHFLLFVVWRSLQLFSKNPFLYLTVFTLTCNIVSKFPNCNLKCFLSLENICVFVFTEIYLLQSRLFSALVAFLACSVLFNTSLLHILQFIKMDPKYLNDLLSLISVLCLSHFLHLNTLF